MNRIALLVAVSLNVLVAGCAVPPLVSSPLPQPDPATSSSSAVLPGDVLTVSYYKNDYQREQTDVQPYKVAVGDILRIDVLDQPELSRDNVRVVTDGYISVTGVPRILAAGKQLNTIADDLKHEYNTVLRLRDPNVSVSLETGGDRAGVLTRSGSLNIPVGQSGYVMLPFIAPVAINRALLDVQDEIVERYKQEFSNGLTVTVNVQSQTEPVLYVMGEVRKPGAIDFERAMDPLTAIAAAGGFAGTAAPSDVRIFRRQDDGTYLQWSFDLAGALAEGVHSQRTLVMKQRDVVFVRKSGIAMANDFVQLYIRNMMPTNTNVGFSYLLNPQNNDDNNNRNNVLQPTE